jgi:3-hydroxybutyryl-CoA dehydrogenase
MAIRKVFVVGSWLMGSAIAQVCAQAGIEVTMQDLSSEAIGKALKNIEWSVDKFVEKGKLKEASAAA